MPESERPTLAEILNQLSLSPRIDFKDELPFSDEDKEQFPWLAQPVRHYVADEILGFGGMSIALLARPCGPDGAPLKEAPQVVIKVPNLSEEFDSDAIEARTRHYQRHVLQEWSRIRRQLRGCRAANPVFDACTHIAKINGENYLIWLTAQPLVSDGVTLKDYLVAGHLKQQEANDRTGKPVDNWRGLDRWEDWFDLAEALASALKQIHDRRVVHGDIWPPNVFIRSDGDSCLPVFIDFGEAFGAEPTGESRAQPNNNAYRAPEREGDEVIVGEPADVYSLGKLLLYLATGRDEIIPRHLRGHDRRTFIRDYAFSRNETLIKEHPEILDVICRCVMRDPEPRPSAAEILCELQRQRQLQSFAPAQEVSLPARLEQLVARAEGLRDLHPAFARMIDVKITELELALEGLEASRLTLVDTRDRLVDAMVQLFSVLGQNDIFASLTSPNLWQENALGVDGRYSTASVMAARRGVSIHRAFVFSIQEVGLDWSRALTGRLQSLGTPGASELAHRIDKECAKFEGRLADKTTSKWSREAELEGRTRLRVVVSSLKRTIGTWLPPEVASGDGYTSIDAVKGVFFGLLVVSTKAELNEMKSRHPVSLIRTKNDADEDQWLLMRTDCQGRSGHGISSPNAQPKLRAVRLFSSSTTIPVDTILRLEGLFRRATDVTSWLPALDEIMAPTETELTVDGTAAVLVTDESTSTIRAD